MGFPVPLTEWARGPLRDFVLDSFAAGRRRDYLAGGFSAEELLRAGSGFDRTLWGLLSLELWHQRYHDRTMHWDGLRRRMLTPDVAPVAAAGA